MLRPIYLFLPLFLVPFSGIAQSNGEQNLQALKKELKGTYQIQMLGTRKKAAIPMSLYGKIDSARKEKEVVYYEVSDLMRVKILPRQTIEAKGFKSLPKEVVHVSENGAK